MSGVESFDELGRRWRTKLLAMNPCIVVTVALGLVLGTACKSIPRDECERFLPAPSAPAPDAKFITNVEPRSFLGVALDSVTKNRLIGVGFVFQDLQIFAYTDSLGVARFRDLPLGWHGIAIRRIGYESRRDSIQVSPSSGTVGVYELPRRKVHTCDVVITK
jgi:hypothetical protein